MNYTALLVAAVVSFIIGMLWYSPVLFGNLYMKTMPHHDGNRKGMAMMMVMEFIFGLIQAYALWRILNAVGAATIDEAFMAVAVLWVGFTVINAWSVQMWENRNVRGMRITVFGNLARLLAVAAVLILAF